ncbi:hypothetical protein ACIQMY_14845 [Streptomyces sp. NPDC091368]|uniref:hypothetical protein n=1 Tax=Streptomyces sp. NPDC091368 TaxID=3365993 RepID=UPI003820E111
MRWTALLAKTVVTGAAGAFLAVSAAGVAPPRQASDADAGRETPADQHPTAAGAPSASPTPGHLSP